jgi:hypothetical protein
MRTTCTEQQWRSSITMPLWQQPASDHSTSLGEAAQQQLPLHLLMPIIAAACCMLQLLTVKSYEASSLRSDDVLRGLAELASQLAVQMSCRGPTCVGEAIWQHITFSIVVYVFCCIQCTCLSCYADQSCSWAVRCTAAGQPSLVLAATLDTGQVI